MARAGVLIWALAIFVASASPASAIGVNWGTMASHTLHPRVIVQMCKDNGFEKVKLFDSDPWTVGFFAGTGLELMLAIPNSMLKDMSKDYDNAKEWVKANVTVHQGKVNIKYVAVGNEPFLTSYNGSYQHTTFPAMQNIQKALNAAGHGTVKVTCPLNADVYESASNKPSDGAFRADIKEPMQDIVDFLKANDAPFVVNIYPFLSLYANPDFPAEFAFFEGRSKPVTDKGGVSYTNVFDANYDTLVWALKKADAPDLKILVGEIGWPTDGNINANVTAAKRFYDGFFKKQGSPKKGTPLRPGEAAEVYLFGLTDEDQKSVAPGNFERHWGIFRYDGKPKFQMDITGKGQNVGLVAAKGVQYQPSQWCVLDKDMVNKQNFSSLQPLISYACSESDCTALGLGSSCNSLDKYANVSYGFNMYYQTQDQAVPACDFEGKAQVVKTNPSTRDCIFPVQIVQNAGERLRLGAAAVGLMVLLLLTV